MIDLIDRTIIGLLFAQLILNCCEFCGAATWMPDLLLLVVHTTSIFKLAECKVLGSIPYVDNYEVLDSNPERDKLAECEFIGSNYERERMLYQSSNPKWDKMLVLGSNPRWDKIWVLGSNPEFDNCFVTGSNPKFDNSEVKGLILKKVTVHSIDWFEVFGWINRWSCINNNWCRFRNFYGSDDDDEDYSLSGSVT